ncbi:BppU family phage baseplate upper protein [Clostridium perfringens]|uniref:BppU family phage baseplate upper protein n=1 Tax=Clostridium perfringens TaxID=1502 RepID=UPI0013E368E8|nr:BppU family phage baseplate upper protein [Clostridium perfringens]NGT47735.1 BppU family phage baseplate upper protein [Clostridium perfringens]
MSEIGLNINVDSYNNEGIKTIKGNNNAEIYKLYILKNKRRLSLVGKTVKLGYVMVGTTNGDVIENLNITNAEQGEITFPITNRISKQDGVYSCQLAIYGADGFLEHTATFGLTVEANIFTKIAGEIADSKDFTYLENILDKANKLSEKLKENTSSATNANSNLESNITEANNINSKLLENTSTATSLNKNLESNINLAKEVKETIKDLDNKNIEATEKIQTLTGLNFKAEELSNNIQQGLPLNSELVKNVESAKTANNELIATNNDAKTKKTDLDNSLEEAKKYISGLDGSQNIPQLRLDVTELQNGLKSNQALSYEGSSISANDTLEGRTEGMRIGGRTLVNLWDIKTTDGFYMVNLNNGYYIESNKNFSCKPNTKYTVIYNEKIPTDCYASVLYKDANGLHINEGANCRNGQMVTFTTPNNCYYLYTRGFRNTAPHSVSGNGFNFIIVEGELKDKIKYFEGIKSFGEQEKVGDKYKISILSSGKNLINFNEIFSKLSYVSVNRSDKTITATNEAYNDVQFYVYLRKGKAYKFSYKGNIGNTGSIMLGKQKGYVAETKIQDIYNINDSFVFNHDNGIYTFHIVNIRGTISSIQLEEVQQSTTYEPYKQDKKDILIKEPLHEGNYLYEDNGQVKVYKEAKKYIFNGDENWSKHSNSGNGLFVAIIWDGFSDCSPTSSVVCNKLKNERTTSKENVIYFVSKCPIITVSEKTIGGDTVEHFKTWLKSNPIEIIYQLATPTIEVVENCVDIDLDTFEEKTYFNILNSLPGTLDFKVPSNIGSSLQNLAKEVNNIWDVINNLLVPSILDVNKKVALATIKNNLK